MCDIRFFRRAWLDYRAAVNFMEKPENDEAYINIVAYHLQQAVEKTLKGFLEFVGVTIPNTHDISRLVQMSKNNGSRVELTEWVIWNSDMITRWEMDTRYNMDFVAEINKVTIGLQEIKCFLDINGLKEELRDELKSNQVVEELKTFFPKGYLPADDFEWNCYYQVYKKKLQQKLGNEA